MHVTSVRNAVTGALAISADQKQLLQHMLGADSRYLKKQWGFRNHFVSTLGNKDHENLLVLEKSGLVKRGERMDSIVFWATKEGALAIGFKPYQLRKTKLAA